MEKSPSLIHAFHRTACKQAGSEGSGAMSPVGGQVRPVDAAERPIRNGGSGTAPGIGSWKQHTAAGGTAQQQSRAAEVAQAPGGGGGTRKSQERKDNQNRYHQHADQRPAGGAGSSGSGPVRCRAPKSWRQHPLLHGSATGMRARTAGPIRSQTFRYNDNAAFS